jgi:hypothetical protein
MHNTSLFQNALSVTKAIYELADSNLENNDLLDNFPRDIESFILYGLEIPVVRLPGLSLQNSSNYLCVLTNNTTLCEEETDDRPLYGLLHVGPPSNIIFVREGLPPPVVNYVLAHEIGHLIADVFWIHQLWLATMPEKKAAIQSAFNWENLDGDLELAAVIKGLPDRPITITGRGNLIVEGTSEREIQADLIARELLAPWERVSKVFLPNRQEMSILLQEQFGLPKKIAYHYSDDLTECLTNHPDTIDRLFGPLLQGSDSDTA